MARYNLANRLQELELTHQKAVDAIHRLAPDAGLKEELKLERPLFSKWVAGTANPGPVYVYLLCLVLDRAPAEIDLADCWPFPFDPRIGRRNHVPALRPQPLLVHPSMSAAELVDSDDMRMRRRAFVELLALAGVSAYDAERLATILVAGTRPDDSGLDRRNAPGHFLSEAAEPGRDLDVVSRFEALLLHYRHLDDLIGASTVLSPVSALYKALDRQCRDSAPTAREALLRVSAQFGQLLGWLWTDTGNQAAALLAYDSAISRATEGGHQDLVGYLLACKSELAFLNGDATTAISLAQAARRSAFGLSHSVSAWAAEREARAWALVGDEDQCKRQLHYAEEQLSRSCEKPEDEPPWIYYYSERVLAVHTGICLIDLGQAEEAVSAFDSALQLLPPELVRDRANYLSYAAKAYAVQRNIERAALVARDAAYLAISTHSVATIDRLRALHSGLSQTHDDPAIQELAELLRT